MNSQAPSRPRLTCRLVRIWSSSHAPTSGWTARHVAACPDCQHYFAAADELDAQLRRHARRAASPVPAGLEDRLFAAIEPTLAARRPQGNGLRGWAWAASGVAAAAAVAFGVWQLRGPQHPGVEPEMVQQQEAGPESFEVNAGALAVLERLPDNLWSAVAPRAETLTQENLLQREFTAVQADTRSALRFLARNFLPGEPTLFEARDESASSSS